MGRNTDVSEHQRQMISVLLRTGKTQKEIAEEAGCSQATVSRVKKQMSSGLNQQSRRQKCRGKRATTARDDRILQRIVKANRFKPVRHLHALWERYGVNVSRSTALRRIHEFKFAPRVPNVKPKMTKHQRQARVKWCNDRLLWGLEEWSDVLFSDESVFCVMHGNQGARVWRKTSEAFDRECLKRSVKFQTAVMVWGCMSADGVGELCILNTRVNSEVYQEVLEHFMLPSAEDLCTDDFYFQQDGASCHTSNSTRLWLQEHQVKLLPWPANSPDLNPIENLWRIMKQKLCDNPPMDKKDLIAKIKHVWSTITRETCRHLVYSLPSRLQAVINARGDATKY